MRDLEKFRARLSKMQAGFSPSYSDFRLPQSKYSDSQENQEKATEFGVPRLSWRGEECHIAAGDRSGLRMHVRGQKRMRRAEVPEVKISPCARVHKIRFSV
jgi:hypothetical protein